MHGIHRMHAWCDQLDHQPQKPAISKLEQVLRKASRNFLDIISKNLRIWTTLWLKAAFTVFEMLLSSSSPSADNWDEIQDIRQAGHFRFLVSESNLG